MSADQVRDALVAITGDALERAYRTGIAAMTTGADVPRGSCPVAAEH